MARGFWAIVLLSLAAVRLSNGTADGNNVRQYAVLCRVAVEAQELLEADTTEATKTLSGRNGVREVQERLKGFIGQLNDSSEPDAKIKLQGGLEVIIKNKKQRDRATLLLQALLQKTNQIQKHVEELETNTQTNFQRAQTDAAGALGQKGSDLEASGKQVAAGMTSANRANVCKNPGSDPAKPGSSLPHDLLCLCTTQSSQHKACGVNIDSHAWNSGSFSQAGDAWVKLAKNCEKLRPKKKWNGSQSLSGALSDFEKALGGGVVTGTVNNPEKAPWILGEIKANTNCDGDTNGRCVNYAKNGCTDHTNCERETILWYEKLEGAVKKLKQVEENARQSVRLGDKADLLLETAGHVLLEANTTSLDEQHPASQRDTESRQSTLQAASSDSAPRTINQSVEASSKMVLHAWFLFNILVR